MPEPALTNRRRCDRTDVEISVMLVVDSDRSKIAHNAFAVDLSRLGARIRPSIKLLPGQHITVIPNEGSAQAVPSCVIWVGEEGSERNGEAGIAFLQPLTLDP